MAGKGNDMQPLDIAIVGCGTSGLAAALFLTHRGHKVTLLERFDTPRPLGAGLLLQPTGLACLAALGLDDAVIGMGAKIHNLYGRTAKGRVIFDITYRDLHPNRFGLGIQRTLRCRAGARYSHCDERCDCRYRHRGRQAYFARCVWHGLRRV